MTLFYSLRGALGEDALLQEHEEAILNLLQGTCAPSDIERLVGHKQVYSLRLNLQARLLFTIHRVQGKDYLLVLDYLPTHDYHKSRFLKYGLLQQYLEKQEEAYAQAVQVMEEAENPLFEKMSSQEFQDLINPLQINRQEYALAQPHNLDRSVLDFYQHQWIELSEEQQEILELSLPTAVTGAAGSGKSCIALSLLSARAKLYLRTVAEDEKEELPSLLYVTETQRLAEEMGGLWKALPVSRDTQGWVRFLTYQQLLQELVALPPETTWVGFDEFNSWYNSYYLAREKTQAKIRKKPLNIISSHLLYQEFRIASGHTAEQYGTNTEKQAVYANYQHYVDTLKTQRKIDAALYTLPFKNCYDLIIADEVQNFSLGQLTVLNKLAKKNAFAAFGDPHQDTANHRPVFPFLWNLLGIKKSQRKELQLTYRSPSQVVGIANEILAFKRNLLGGLRYKGESTGIQAMTAKHQGGHFFLVQEQQLDACPWLRQAPKGANFAVVTLPKYQKKAKKIFQTDCVFTPDQIKGSEFSFVLVFRLFSHYDELFLYASQRIKQVNKLGQQASLHLPKEHREDKKFDEYLNQLNEIYMLCTRATRILVLCREPTPHNSVFFDRLLPLAEQILPAEFLLTPANDPEDWKKQILTLYRTGNPHNQALAWSLFQNKLAKSKEEFEAFVSLTPDVPIDEKSEDQKSDTRPQKSNDKIQGVASKAGQAQDPKPSPPSKGHKGSPKQVSLSLNLQVRESQSSEVRSQAALNLKIPAPVCAEATQALILSKGFEARRLEHCLRNLNIRDLFLKAYPNEKGVSFTLIESLLSKPQCDLFINCLLNNPDILVKFPAFSFLLYFTEKKNMLYAEVVSCLTALQPVHERVSESSLAQSFSIESKKTVFTLAIRSKDLVLLASLQKLIPQLPDKQLFALSQLAVEQDYREGLFALRKFGLNLLGLIHNKTFLVHLAAQQGALGILRALHEAQADLSQKDLNGITPADYAIKHHQQAALDFIQSLAIEKLTYLPPIPLPNIIKREAMKTLFRDKITSVQVIRGPAGVGKTQAAFSYAREQIPGKTFVRWIAADRYNLEKEWRILGKQLGLNLEEKSEEETIQRIQVALSQEENWLLVLDNLENQKAILRLLPQNLSPNQQVLITTRSQQWDAYPVLTLAPFTRREAKAYEESHLDPDLWEDTTLLLSLEYLPLALSLAFTQMTQKKQNAKEYLSRFNSRYSMLIQKDKVVAYPALDKRKKTQDVVVIVCSLIREASLSNYREAIELLNGCAYLHFECIQRFLLEKLSMDVSEDALNNYLSIFQEYGLISLGNGGFTMQKAIQEALRTQVLENKKSHTYLLKIVQCLTESIEGEQLLVDQELALVPHLEILADHYQQNNQEDNYLAAILKKLGCIYGILLTQYKKSATYLERALKIFNPSSENDRGRLASLLISLSQVYGSLGEMEIKGDYLKRAADVEETLYGTYNPKVIPTLSNLAQTYSALGQPKQQCVLLERILAIQVQRENHLEAAHLFVDIGIVYGTLENMEKKVGLLEQALGLFNVVYPKDHRLVADTLVEFGSAYYALGNSEEACKQLERALPLVEKNYGENSCQVVSTLTKLAIIYDEQQQAQASIQAAERALRILMEHPWYIKELSDVQQYLLNLQSLSQDKIKDLQHQESTTVLNAAALQTYPGVLFHSEQSGRSKEEEKGLNKQMLFVSLNNVT